MPYGNYLPLYVIVSGNSFSLAILGFSRSRKVYFWAMKEEGGIYSAYDGRNSFSLPYAGDFKNFLQGLLS